MQLIDGIIHFYFYPIEANAPTILEHMGAFKTHSQHPVWEVNTVTFPPALHDLSFKVVLLHYSLFGTVPYGLGPKFLNFLKRHKDAYIIAVMQDEMRFNRQRYSFLDEYSVDCLYTLVEPRYFDQTYRVHTRVPLLEYTTPGLVSADLVAKGNRLTRPLADRPVDVGYRARHVPYYLGRGGQEKHLIAEEFQRRTAGSGLVLDISAKEEDRIYGEAWYEFVAGCKSMLGVEAGASLFDMDDEASTLCGRLLAANPALTFKQAWEAGLSRLDGNIEYRTISPRHFEAAALATPQILFRGNYSGIMEPETHYLPLEKDFSNFQQVQARLKDTNAMENMAQRAKRDLIDSGRYTYENFVKGFDSLLATQGILPTQDQRLAAYVAGLLAA